MNKMLLVINFVLLTQFSVFSQEEVKCSKIKIIEPDSIIRHGEIMNFSVAENTKNDFEKAEFEWSVDKGKIIKGQGTSKIEVATEDLDNSLDGITLNVTLEISNLPSSCKSSFLGSGIVLTIGDVFPNDQYGRLSLKDEFARLDSFIVELQNIPESQGFIIISLQEKGSRKKVESHVRKLLKHINYRKFPAKRITFLLKKDLTVSQTVLWRFPKNSAFDLFGKYEIIHISK